MTTTVGERAEQLTSGDVRELARRYRAPREDVLLLALNLHGVTSEVPRARARLGVRLSTVPNVLWTVIVPTNASRSPFRVLGNTLVFDGAAIGTVEQIDPDEAVGGYFRDGGRAATLNPNARSRCVGCAFCPNTLEAAADPRLSEQRTLSDLLVALEQQHPDRDLSQLREVTVSTGCFASEQRAVAQMLALRSALTEHHVNARIGLLTSVLRSDRAFERLATEVGPFVLRLTIECFTRRALLLKASKAELQVDSMPQLLSQALQAGLATSFTYIVGLDDLDTLDRGVGALRPWITDFPNFQVYQAHNAIMAGLRAPGAEHVEFYLRARRSLERILGSTGLRPQPWECYRPLWYCTFDGENLVDAE